MEKETRNLPYETANHPTMVIENTYLTPAQLRRLENGKCIKGSIRLNPETKVIEFRAYNLTPAYRKRNELRQTHSRTQVGRRGMSFRFYYLLSEGALSDVLHEESQKAAQFAEWTMRN